MEKRSQRSARVRYAERRGEAERGVLPGEAVHAPAAVDTISEKSYKELNVTVPEPEITNVEVTNDTHVKAEWEWKDASGRTVPTEATM